MSKEGWIKEIRIKLARLCHPDHYMNLRCDLPQMSVEGLGDLLSLLDKAVERERPALRTLAPACASDGRLTFK